MCLIALCWLGCDRDSRSNFRESVGRISSPNRLVAVNVQKPVLRKAESEEVAPARNLGVSIPLPQPKLEQMRSYGLSWTVHDGTPVRSPGPFDRQCSTQTDELFSVKRATSFSIECDVPVKNGQMRESLVGSQLLSHGDVLQMIEQENSSDEESSGGEDSVPTMESVVVDD